MRLYLSAGKTAYISCGFTSYAKSRFADSNRPPVNYLANCASAKIYVEAGGIVECKSISYVSDYPGDANYPTVTSQPCPTEIVWDGSSSTGTFEDFIRENEAKFNNKALPVDSFPDPSDFFVDVKDPLFVVGLIAVISILLNCCQSYKLFGGFRSTSRKKKVYQGIAQTDNSDVDC